MTHLEQKTKEVHDILDTIRDVAHFNTLSNVYCSAQAIYQILRLCISGRFMHYLRVLPPVMTVAYAHDIDEKTFSTLISVLGYREEWGGLLDPQSRPYTCAFLPLAMGGLGLHSLALSARPAFVGSLALVGPRVASILQKQPDKWTVEDIAGAVPHLDSVLDALTSANLLVGGREAWQKERFFVPPDRGSPLRGARGVQHAVYTKMAEAQRDRILALLKNDNQERENFLTGADPSATACLTASVAIPMHRIRDADFTSFALTRIGAINPAHKRKLACAKCGEAVQAKSYAHHAHSCQASKGYRTSRHARVNGTLQRVVESLPGKLFSVQHEPLVEDLYARRADVTMAEHDTKHRGDLLVLHRGNSNVRYLCDLVITYPNSKTAGVGDGKGAQCANAEARKLSHYNKFYRIPEKELVPFAVQPNGFMGHSSTRVLRDWCWSAAMAHAQTNAGPCPKDKPQAQHDKDIRAAAKTKYFELLSTARARIGASIVSWTVPQISSLLRSARASGPSASEPGPGV